MRRILMAGALLVGFASLAWAQTVILETADQVLSRAFGPIDTAAGVEVSCGANASGRNGTALKKHVLHRVSCTGDVRFEWGGSTVAAVATDDYLAGGAVEQMNSGSNDYFACYGVGVAAKCTLSPKKRDAP